MKRKLMMTSFALMAFCSVFAQDSTRAVNAKAKGLEAYNQAWNKLDQTLKLTPEQTQQWKDLNKKYAQQEQAVATDKTLSQTEKVTQMEGIHTQKETELGTILTPAQTKEWTAIQKTVKNTASSDVQAAKTAKAAHAPRPKTFKSN